MKGNSRVNAKTTIQYQGDKRELFLSRRGLPVLCPASRKRLENLANSPDGKGGGGT